MKRRIFLDMHFPDWPDRQTCTHFDPDRIAETMIASHVDSVILYAKCQFGNFYYDTKLGHKHRGLGVLDLFREVSDRLKRAGIEVIAYYSVSWDERIAAEHPEWLVEGPNGERDNLSQFRWSTLCVNSPYRDVVFSHLREISALLRPDGFWIDMTIIGNDRCFCPHCRAKYRAQAGAPLTADALTDERTISRFMQFRYDYIESFYQEAYAAIREILPSANIANNYWGYPYSWPTMGSRAIGALQEANFVTGEAYTDWTGLSAPGYFSKFLRGAAHGRPFEALIGRFLGTWDFTAKPETQLMLEAFTVASNGGTVTVDDEPFADGWLDEDVYLSIARAFREIKAREHLLSGAPVKFAAILHSQLSKDVYHRGSEAFMQSFAGAYRLMRELQCPADIVFDELLTEDALDGYSVLLLPGAAVIDDAHWQVIRSFAERGGLVFAAGAFGLFAVPDGTLTASTTVPSALGLDIEGLSDVTLGYFSVDDADLAARLAKRPQLVRSRYVRASVHVPAQVLAHVVDPICETRDKVFFHNNLPAPYEDTHYPALTDTQLGNGHVFWFAQDIFSQFARYHQTELMTVVSRLMERTGKHSPVALSCASNVEFALTQVDGKTVLHLVNFTPGMGVCCSAMDTFEGRYARTFEFVDKVNALCDVRITLKGRFTQAKAFALDRALDVVQDGENSVLTLPRLNMWESIELT